MVFHIRNGDRRGRGCMVVGSTTTCGISEYYHISSNPDATYCDEVYQ